MNDSPMHIERKPWLSIEQQIQRLSLKGVQFNSVSKEEAAEYLAKNNNYFRIKSYCKGFQRIESGPRAGTYIGLDFGALIDLSVIDMMLRNTMLDLTLDIEHFSKIQLLSYIEDHGEDGYRLVSDFCTSNNEITENGMAFNRIESDLLKKAHDPYIGLLLQEHPYPDLPVWVFLEVIPFGTFIYFARFCGEHFDDKRLQEDFYLLQNTRSLRNACAHNNCIVDGFASGDSQYPPPRRLTQAISRIPNIGSNQRKRRLKNERMKHIATTLTLHSERASGSAREYAERDLEKLVSRMNENIGYYKQNEQIISSFSFIEKMINGLY